MKIAVTVETAADLTEEIIKEFDLKVVPFGITLGDKFGNDGEITTDEIIEFVNKNKVLPKTSAVNENAFDEFFGKVLKDYDGIIHFSLSDKLSSAYSNAVSAAEKHKNVKVVNSKSLSTGIGLLAIYCAKLLKGGATIDEAYEACEKRIKSVQASFVLKRLDYLYRGGRCSALAYFGANILRIKPQIIVTDGKMVSGKKYRGDFAYVVKKYVADTLETFNTPDLEEIFITYTTADKEIIDGVKEEVLSRGFKNVRITRAGGTITSHCGENCLGILYINDGDKMI